MTDIDPKIRVCAVCGYVLDYVAEGPDGQETWLHLHNPDGHIAVPALPTEVHTNGRCDICAAMFPRFELPAADFEVPPVAGAPTGTGSRGNWACCDECAKLIDTNQWTRAVDRAQAAIERNRGGPLSPAEVTHLRHLYRRLRANITGPVRPLTWPTPPTGK